MLCCEEEQSTRRVVKVAKRRSREGVSRRPAPFVWKPLAGAEALCALYGSRRGENAVLMKLGQMVVIVYRFLVLVDVTGTRLTEQHTARVLRLRARRLLLPGPALDGSQTSLDAIKPGASDRLGAVCASHGREVDRCRPGLAEGDGLN